ncbi:MAG: SEC-C metal-binding domain-containing protein, partial [Acidimicrobiales bacterium]
DELLRLFATGAMSWVMGRTLPEDIPIESKTVAKAIERAQNTVEARNAEIRKDVLKYDEVMNEQRKVVYARRMQVLDGEDLRARTVELLESAVDTIVADACPGDFPEEWELDGLVNEVHQYYPTQFTSEDLAEAVTSEQIAESILAEALEYYESREVSMPGGAEMARELEREIMLQIIDQRWREHLAEMDYLREGINLRAMGQQDPLVAWQKDGYEMFGQLMSSIDDDYLRYVLHVEVLAAPAPEPDLAQAHYLGADEPVPDLTSLGALSGQPVLAALGPEGDAALGDGAGGRDWGDGEDDEREAEVVQLPVVRAEQEKVGRNQPCWCGSGRKYKLCHGR